MIRYLEITPPPDMQLGSAKIIRAEVAEGDAITAGDALFILEINKQEVPLPSTTTGTVTELIAHVGERVNRLTPLVLLETEVVTQVVTEVKAQADQQTEAAPKPKEAASKNTKEKPMSDSDTLIKVPDIGGDSAKVVEILVEVGQSIDIDTPIVTLESDKASMEVPSSQAGTITKIHVDLDQDISEGDALIEVSEGAASEPTQDKEAENDAAEPILEPESVVSAARKEAPTNNEHEPSEPASKDTKDASAGSDGAGANQTQTVVIPDIGDGSAKVVEILVSVGDQVDLDDPILTLESDKASMEVPSAAAGKVVEITVQLDDDVTEGDAVLTLSVAGGTAAAPDNKRASQTTPAAEQTSHKEKEPKAQESTATRETAVQDSPVKKTQSASAAHASPSVRRFARELGADIDGISGSGRKGRITKEDIKTHIKQLLAAKSSPTNNPPAQAPAASGTGIPAIKNPDFTKFGEIEEQPLSKIKRLTAQNLHRSWLNVPHVTHHDEANIEDLEGFRKQTNAEFKQRNKPIKLSPLAFIVKAVVNALKAYPQFNSSLSEDGERLILKKYIHIGIAVETPDGLVVPVIRNADLKSVAEIAEEMGALAQKARDKKLSMADMSGAGFSISSLGGIGGTAFTPIVNAPEVAILGVSRTKIQPFYNGSEFVPAPYLPLSLSYDHRVIDGAEAARFTRHIADVLEDVRRLTI